jgi:hypothetical protein
VQATRVSRLDGSGWALALLWVDPSFARADQTTSALFDQVNATLAKAAHAQLSPAAVTAGRKKVALGLAAIADLVQAGYFPIFGEGALSPPDDLRDHAVVIMLVLVLGFRWRLVMALAMELVPGATLFPTWTAVVLSLPTVPSREDAEDAKVAAAR